MSNMVRAWRELQETTKDRKVGLELVEGLFFLPEINSRITRLWNRYHIYLHYAMDLRSNLHNSKRQIVEIYW